VYQSVDHIPRRRLSERCCKHRARSIQTSAWVSISATSKITTALLRILSSGRGFIQWQRHRATTNPQQYRQNDTTITTQQWRCGRWPQPLPERARWQFIRYGSALRAAEFNQQRPSTPIRIWELDKKPPVFHRHHNAHRKRCSRLSLASSAIYLRRGRASDIAIVGSPQQ